MFLVFRHKWAVIFNDDPEVTIMVAKVLPLVALFQIFDGIAGVANGILRARGKQGTGALINLRSVCFHCFLRAPPNLILGTLAAHTTCLASHWVCTSRSRRIKVS